MRHVIFCALISVLAWLSPAMAHQITSHGLIITHPWTRATPPGAGSTAGYVTIRNTNARSETLIGATAEFAGLAELHENLTTADGVMQMRPLKEGIEIAPGATVVLAPSGKHLMFQKLSKPLQADLLYAGTLIFAKAGSVVVEFFVEPIGAKEPHHP